MYRIDFKKNL